MKTKILKTLCVLVAIATLLAILSLCVCESAAQADCGYKVKELSEKTIWVQNYIDPETGICYLISSKGGMTVRYNADGSIMIKGDLK